MICSKSKYNDQGDLIYRITSGQKTFPEILEVEYNEYGLKTQSLYDLVANEKNKEFKKLKMRTEINYDDEGRVSNITTPESIAIFSYEIDESVIDKIKPSFVDEDLKYTFKSKAATEFLLKNEDGSDKPDTVCYVLEVEEGTLDHGILKNGFLNVKFDSVRILYSYEKGTDNLICTEYFFIKDKKVVYYCRYIGEDCRFEQITEYNENELPVYITSEDFDEMTTTIVRIEYNNVEELRSKWTGDPEFLANIYDTSKRVIDMNTEDEIEVEESVYEYEEINKDRNILRNKVTQYNNESNESNVFTSKEYTIDDHCRIVKEVDNFEHTTKTIVYPYDDFEDTDTPSRMYIRHTQPQKITQFTKSKTTKNEDVYMYFDSVFEDKIIAVELVKYPNGYITKAVRIVKDDKEIATYYTDNGQDASVSILFDALYEECNF